MHDVVVAVQYLKLCDLIFGEKGRKTVPRDITHIISMETGHLYRGPNDVHSVHVRHIHMSQWLLYSLLLCSIVQLYHWRERDQDRGAGSHTTLVTHLNE